MKRALNRAVVVVGLALVGAACSADGDSGQRPAAVGGSGGNSNPTGGTGVGGGISSSGGTATGGSGTGGSAGSSGGQTSNAGKSSGGTSTGGAASGGTSSAGTANGGKATGGATSGGSATAGTSSGGTATGGMGTAGTTSTGGAATGGAAGAGTGGSAGTAGGSGGASCATLVTPINRSGTYVLEFGNTYFAVQRGGGKITELRQKTGSNLLALTGVNPQYAFVMGSTLWTSPQTAWGWPPPTTIDSDDFTATADEAAGTITMLQPDVKPNVGPDVRVTKVYKANLCEEAIDITYTVTNRGTSALSTPLAAWEVTRVLPGGLMFFPPFSVSAEPTIKNDSTDATIISVSPQSNYWWYSNPTESTAGSKLFADGSGGWLAFTDGTNLFVKQWTDVPAASQISGEAEVEIYNGNTYVEIENQGPSATLTGTPPGNSTTFQMRWYVRPLPGTAQKTAGNQGLIDAVTALMQ